MSLRTHLCRTFLFTGTVLLFCVSVCSAEILLKDGQLSVQVEGRSLQAILDEIGRQGHISIQLKGALVEQGMSFRFGPVPLEKGLKRILKSINYLTVYDQDAHITTLVIVGSMPTQSSGPAARLSQVQQPAPSPVEPAQPVELNEQHPASPEVPGSGEEGPKNN